MIAPLPLWTRNTEGVNPVSQESENVAQNKVGVQLGQDAHTDPGRGPTFLCSHIYAHQSFAVDVPFQQHPSQ